MIKQAIVIFTLLFSTTYCNGDVLSQRGSYLKPYHLGQFELAEFNITQITQKELPKNNYTKSNEASWLLLDRATLRFAMGNVCEALEDYRLAIESLEYYDYIQNLDGVKQILFQDEASAYIAPDFEQLLARLYFSFALLHKGDRSNAFALLRNAEEFLQKKEHYYKKFPFSKEYRMADNALIRYLFAVLLEKKGDISNANILYEKLQQEPVTKSNQATVLVVCHNGNSPYKISATSPASVASALAIEFFLSTQRIDPAWSSLTGIPIPALSQWPLSAPQPIYASVGNQRQLLYPFYNVIEAAYFDLEQQKPVIVAKGVARLLLRRTAVGYVQKQNQFLGLLTDIGMYVANANTRADTRSWTTLPAIIDLTRFDVESGEHELNLELPSLSPYSQNNGAYKLILKPNDLCIVHIFNTHPGVTQVLIPQRFQGE
jgi:uncharacterized protein